MEEKKEETTYCIWGDKGMVCHTCGGNMIPKDGKHVCELCGRIGVFA